MPKFIFILLALISSSVFAGQPVDYRAERLKLAQDANYNPYPLVLMQRTLLEKHFQLANDPKATIDEINAPLKKLLDLYPLGIQVNYAVADFLEYVAKQAEPSDLNQGLLDIAKKKREKADAILQSILSSGDGKSADTAFQVINTLEEYAVLDHLGLEASDQSLLTAPKKQLDRFSTKDKSGVSHSVYFDISLFYGRHSTSE